MLVRLIELLIFSCSRGFTRLSFRLTRYSLLDVPVKSPASDTTGLPHAIHTIVAQKAVKSETLATSVGAAASVGFTAHPPGEGGSCPIVLWHGFGQGAASWWRNLPGLARAHSGPVSCMRGSPVFCWMHQTFCRVCVALASSPMCF